jgi:hypothetical protein
VNPWAKNVTVLPVVDKRKSKQTQNPFKTNKPAGETVNQILAGPARRSPTTAANLQSQLEIRNSHGSLATKKWAANGRAFR